MWEGGLCLWAAERMIGSPGTVKGESQHLGKSIPSESLVIGRWKKNPGNLVARSTWRLLSLSFPTISRNSFAGKYLKMKIKERQLARKSNVRAWDNVKQTFSDLRCLNTFNNVYFHHYSMVLKIRMFFPIDFLYEVFTPSSPRSDWEGQKTEHYQPHFN